MKIVELKSNNIKRIRAVELKVDKDKKLILVTGKNAAGKTSLIDSIWYALGGKKNIPEKPIRDGEETGEISINLEGYIVNRTFTDKGSYLKITNKEGSAYSNPQEFLDFIVGNLSFDPLEFSRMVAKNQIAELIKITGLDFSEIDEKKKVLTEERLIVGRELKNIAKVDDDAVELATHFLQENKELPSMHDLMTEISTAESELSVYNEKQERITELTKKIIEMQAELRGLESVEKPKVKEEEITVMKEKLNNLEEIGQKIVTAKRTVEDSKAWSDKNSEYSNLTVEIQKTDAKKKEELESAKMPVEGLNWTDDEVTYKNIPFNQLSSAEQLKISMSIAMANNPKLKVILIKDGSLLDSKNLEVLEEMVKDGDWQVWIEKVDESGKVGIFIEDGEIKSIN